MRRQRQSLSVKQQTACCVTERQQAGKPVRKLCPTAARRQQNFAAIGAAARRVDVFYNCRSSFNAFPRGVVCAQFSSARSSYGVLGPYKIERYAKLPQRSKTVTTGLGSIKTTWIRVYSASNRLLGLENGWPFRRFGGGATPPPHRPSRLLALSRTSRRASLTQRRAVRAPPP